MHLMGEKLKIFERNQNSINHVLIFLTKKKECSGKIFPNHKHIKYVFRNYLYIGLFKMHCF